MDWIIVENLNNVICVFSNDVSCDEGFLNVRCLYDKKTQRVLYQARSFASSRK